MPMATISSRLTTNGLQQHLHGEATVVQEACVPRYEHCFFDTACCEGLICETWNCAPAG